MGSILEEMVKHEKSLYYLALKKTGCPEDAEDLVQDVYLVVLININNGIVIDNLKSYLMQVMDNLISKLYTKNTELKQSYAEYENEQEIESQKQEYAELEALIKSGKEIEIRKIIAFMPKLYREAIDMYYYKNMKIQKIADVLGVRYKAIEKRLKVGRELIKKRMKTK